MRRIKPTDIGCNADYNILEDWNFIDFIFWCSDSVDRTKRFYL
jgi:hypothetical protein